MLAALGRLPVVVRGGNGGLVRAMRVRPISMLPRVLVAMFGVIQSSGSSEG
jgi:hypothetical protein